MDAQPTITLRDAARKLPRLLNLRKNTAVSELHGLLKSGDLRAGFQFPARAERWIAIPTSYWASIGAAKLRTLFYEEGNTERPGTFKVPIRRFAKEFAQAVSNELQNDQGIQNNPDLVRETLLIEMAEALTASSRRYEVAIRKQDWDDYLDRHQLEEQAPYEPKKGRHQLPAWRDIAIVIGAYLRKHHAVSTNEIKIEEAAKKIHAIAKKRNIAHPPAWTTIKDVLSAIRQLADSLSID